MNLQTNQPNEITITNFARGKVEMPCAERWIMQSRVENRKYQITVATSSEAPPTSGYPVIYLLDANSVFGTMVESLRMQSHRPDKTGVLPAIIVGIGYETDRPFAPDRYYDLTPIPTTEYLHKSDGTPIPEQGGAAAFLTFIEEELKPQIESEFKIDRNRQTIFGHSLGGLFALYTLFTKPSAFQYYIAGSPSIHWNKTFLLEEEQRFISRLEQECTNVEVLIAMGELEKSHISRNYDHAKDMSDRLSVFTDHGVQSEFVEFAGEGHVSILPALISRALHFALKP